MKGMQHQTKQNGIVNCMMNISTSWAHGTFSCQVGVPFPLTITISPRFFFVSSFKPFKHVIITQTFAAHKKN